MGGAAASTTNSRKFLITGAQGFIGAWIVKRLVDRGERPVIFDCAHESHRLQALISDAEFERITQVVGDITNADDVDRAVAEHGATHLIHLAAMQVPACAAHPPLAARTNVIGTLNVFEAARRRRDLVKRIVYASSAAVFGPEAFYGTPRVAEGAPLRPGTHYGVFKECNEGNARVYYQADGISIDGLRPWAVYGVGRDVGLTSGPTKAIKAAVVGRDYVIGFTGGLDLQYVKDTAEIFLRCAESDRAGAHVYTLRGTVTRVEDFIAALEQELPQARGHIRASGPALPMAYDLDNSLLVRDLGEIPNTPLAEGIRETREIFARLRERGHLTTEDVDC